jgi:hypothetical protein
MNGFLWRRSTGLAWGFTLGAAAALYWAWRQMRPRDLYTANGMLDPETIRTIAAGALLADPTLRRHDLKVRVIAPGILDLSGTVDTPDKAERALACVRQAPGVRTVLNRLDIVAELEKLNS